MLFHIKNKSAGYQLDARHAAVVDSMARIQKSITVIARCAGCSPSAVHDYMKRRHILTGLARRKAQAPEVARRYRDGHTVTRIARDLRLSRRTIRNILTHEEGVEIRYTGKLPPSLAPAVRLMLDQGKSVSECAKVFDVTWLTMSKFIRKHGIAQEVEQEAGA